MKLKDIWISKFNFSHGWHTFVKSMPGFVTIEAFDNARPVMREGKVYMWCLHKDVNRNIILNNLILSQSSSNDYMIIGQPSQNWGDCYIGLSWLVESNKLNTVYKIGTVYINI